MFWKIRILTIALLYGLFVAQDASPAALSFKSKPHPPVQISIAPVQSGLLSSNIKPGDVVEFRITVTSMVDTPEMQVHVKLDDGAELISGELSWTGPAMKNEIRILPITIKVPQRGRGSIKAQLSITVSGGTAFTTSSEYELGDTKKPKPGSARPVRKDSKGHNVIEYR
jgi:hypothetical protein